MSGIEVSACEGPRIIGLDVAGATTLPATLETRAQRRLAPVSRCFSVLKRSDHVR
jgi:hypothetical protein